jgi:type II secretory pathway component GspD/PulD (secretin)
MTAGYLPASRANLVTTMPPNSRQNIAFANATQPLAEADGSQPPARVIRIPVGDPAMNQRVQIDQDQERISLTAKDAPLDAILGLLAEQHGLNIVAGTELEQHISVKLTNVTLEDALDSITLVNGYTWARQNNIITVTAIDPGKKMAPALQDRRVQVFTLNYVAAIDVDKVVKGLLSPVGQSFTNVTMPTDQRRTLDQLVVEDLPPYISRVAEYVSQVDIPPSQVVVEAQVLEVSLKDDYRHGVNFHTLARMAGADIIFDTVGLAKGDTIPSSFVHINGTDLTALLEFLYTTTDAKTLATPRVTVLNGQMATIQIGQKLGYKTLQQTQTSTLQNVQFLDTGVILKVTPSITQDNQIMLKVKPSVSDGKIDDNSGLPNSNTTEVDTNVLLCDGEAIILGGLIKEVDQEVISKIPILGDIKYIGWVFRRVAIAREKREIIIALVPRIVSPIPGAREPDQTRIQRVHTPIVDGPLLRVDRRQWEPDLPQTRPRKMQLPPIPRDYPSYDQPLGPPLVPPGEPIATPPPVQIDTLPPPPPKPAIP